MFVAHVLYVTGDLAYTRGGFTILAAAQAEACTAAHRLPVPGAWAVVEAATAQWAVWASGDRSAPVSGILRASGGPQSALAAHWPQPHPARIAS